MSGTRKVSVVLTCEHAGRQIPAALKSHFQHGEKVLESHRGWDPGAFPLAQRFAQELNVPLSVSKVSRLVVELNRSLGHPLFFSEFTQELSAVEKQVLVDRYWQPHRTAVTDEISAKIRSGQCVIHLSVHTFTQYFGEEVRTTDIGLLYDPRRITERRFCSVWRDLLRQENRDWNVRRNDPYKGSSDGFTTSLRKLFAADQYLGLELEVCQKYFLNGGPPWKEILSKIPRSFARAVQQFASEKSF